MSTIQVKFLVMKSYFFDYIVNSIQIVIELLSCFKVEIKEQKKRISDIFSFVVSTEKENHHNKN